jgi:hypothetical protein
MRSVFVILGALALLVGIVWVLQGANVIMNSAMSGSAFWLVAGVVAAIVGGGLLGFGLRSATPHKAA